MTLARTSDGTIFHRHGTVKEIKRVELGEEECIEVIVRKHDGQKVRPPYRRKG